MFIKKNPIYKRFRFIAIVRLNTDEKLIDFSSDADGSASDSNNAKTSRQVTKRPPPGIATKC